MGVVIDRDERARLRALCEAAMLPLCEAADRCGEWYVVQVVPPLTVAEMWNSSAGGNVSRARAQLFAAACTALPALLDALETALRERDEARAEVERLRAAITRLRDNAAEMQSCARAVGHVEEREACAELAEKWLREVDEITQDTPADLADAIRARGTGGAT